MAYLRENDLEVENLLIWKTEIPFENQVRESSNFYLMGLEWCLRFSHKGTIRKHTGFPPTPTTECVFHAISLHRVLDGQVITDEELGRQCLKKSFYVKTYLKRSKGNKETNVNNVRADYAVETLWYAGQNSDNIFKMIPSLYDCCDVEVVCRFSGQPLSAFRLKLGKDNPPSRSQVLHRAFFKDKSVQVSLKVSPNIEHLSSDFTHLLEDEILPDVRLKCGDHTFQAHRSVLAARSQVFRAMFESKMMESETGAVKISDVGAAVLQKLLKFIYSGKANDFTEGDTHDLYEAADKYGVISLKKACACWMAGNLTTENCVKYLKVSDSHSDRDLKNFVTAFIIKNPASLKSAEWLALSKNLPVLAVEVLQTYIALTVQ